jgi:hypothetical protein
MLSQVLNCCIRPLAPRRERAFVGQVEPTADVGRDADAAAAAGADCAHAPEPAVGAATVREAAARRVAVDAEAYAVCGRGPDTRAAWPTRTKRAAGLTYAGVEGAGVVGARTGGALLLISGLSLRIKLVDFDWLERGQHELSVQTGKDGSR